MLLAKIKSDMLAAVKSGDKHRVETLRFLIAAIQNAAIAKYASRAESALTDEDVLAAIKKQVKTHHESIEAFTAGGRRDLVEKEKLQLGILESYLPVAISDSELQKILVPVVATGETNFGLLMKQAMVAVAGKAEGGRVAALLRTMMQK